MPAAVKAQAVDDLLKAIYAGDEEKALSLIPQVNVNELGTDKNSALGAASTFYPKITKALIDAKADPNLAITAGNSPLFNACRWGNAEAVRTLLDAGADVNKENISGTALLASFYFPSATITKMLLDAGAQFKDPVTLVSTMKVHPILHYIRTVKTPSEMVNYYLSSKESWMKLPVKFPDRILNPKESDFTPADQIVRLFVEKGLDVNRLYETGKAKETALEVAMMSGLAEAAKILMDNGAKFDASKDIRMTDRTNNPNAFFPNLNYSNGDFVLGAVLSNNIDLVRLMVGQYPKFISKKYKGKGFVRCKAYNTGRVKDQYFEVEDIDLLMVAAEHGNVEIVKYLIAQGAGKGKIAKATLTGVQDKSMMCPFLNVRWTMAFAKNSGNPEVVELVKKAGHSKE